MEGHVQEHGPLYTSVPFVMFDECGWVGGGVVWCGVLWCGVVVVVCGWCVGGVCGEGGGRGGRGGGGVVWWWWWCGVEWRHSA